MDDFWCWWWINFMIKLNSHSWSPSSKTYKFQFSGRLDKPFVAHFNSPSRSKVVLERFNELFNASTSPFHVHGMILSSSFKIHLMNKLHIFGLQDSKTSSQQFSCVLSSKNVDDQNERSSSKSSKKTFKRSFKPPSSCFVLDEHDFMFKS